MGILICNNACNSPNINVWICLGGAATMVAGIETFNRARKLESRQFGWKPSTILGPLRHIRAGGHHQPDHLARAVPAGNLTEIATY